MCELLQSTKDVLLLSIVIKADVTLMHSLLVGGEENGEAKKRNRANNLRMFSWSKIMLTTVLYRFTG